QVARPLPLGSPVRAKLTQYDDTISASLMSAGDFEARSGELVSGNTRTAFRLLKTYGISAVCVARRFGLPGSVGGSCVKWYSDVRFPIAACDSAYRHICHAISSLKACSDDFAASSSEPAG